MYPYIDFLGLNIPSYGLCMAVAIVLCGFLFMNKSCRAGQTFENMIIIVAAAVGIGLLGGGLLYIIVTYSPKEIYDHIRSGDFSFITNGGLVFYGGLVGGVLGALVSAKLLNVKLGVLEVCTVPFIPLGHAIGRVGCLLAGCCFGLPYEGRFAVTSVFGSIGETYFPIQIAEALCNLLIMAALLLYIKKERPEYSVISLYLIMYSAVRFFLEFFRGDIARGSFLLFSTSQWISLLIFVCSAIMLFVQTKQKINR